MPLTSALLLASTTAAAKLLLDMLIIFAAAKLAAELFERFGQPGIVGEILAGVLIGPAVLGWIQPNDFLAALSDLGVMFLLFRVGLEVRAAEITRGGAMAMAVAVSGIVVPFGLGYAIAHLFGKPTIESLFIGAAMVATSVGITAKVLAAKGLLSHRASQLILAAAIVDDVLGLIVLATVGSFAQGGVNIVNILLTAALAIGFTVFVAYYGTRVMVRVMPHVEARFSAGEVQFNVAMVVLFALSVLAIYAGVAAIIGAFLAGMALAESVDHRVHDLSHGVTELLVPFFLAGIGFHLDLKLFAQPAAMVFAVSILAAAILSKMVPCGLAAFRLGRADMFRVGAGMVPRGEVGMVVAQMGLTLGAVSAESYGVVVFMSVLTTMVAPPLLSAAYRDASANGSRP